MYHRLSGIEDIRRVRRQNSRNTRGKSGPVFSGYGYEQNVIHASSLLFSMRGSLPARKDSWEAGVWHYETAAPRTFSLLLDDKDEFCPPVWFILALTTTL